MNTPLNSNAFPCGHLTPSGISRVFSNFHTLVFAPLCNSLIPNNLFTLSKNKGVYPQKAKLRRNSGASVNSAISVADFLLFGQDNSDGVGLVLGDRGRGEDFAEDGEDFGDAKWLLQPSRLVRAGGRRIDEISGHVNDDRLVRSGRRENLRRSFVSGERMPVGREIDIAQKNV